MNRKILAICDTGGEYACRLMEYLEERRSLPYEIHAFTSPDTLLAFAKDREIEVLMISEAARSEQVEQIPAGRRIVLTEEESTGTDLETHICKYQSAGAILNQMTAACSLGAGPKPEAERAVWPSIRGVYAPAGGSACTAFALALCRILGEEREVLYLNLRNYSGLEILIGERFSHTVSDFIYIGRRDAAEALARLPRMVERTGAFSILPPAASPEDLMEVSGEEWVKLLRILAENGDFDTVIVEFSDAMRDLPEVLDICSRVYIVTGEDAIARAAAEQFCEHLRTSGKQELLSRCVHVAPPAFRGEAGDDLFSPVGPDEEGAFVRQILTREREGYGVDAGDETAADGASRRGWRTVRRGNPRTHR